jgi:hypothetical protein
MVKCMCQGKVIALAHDSITIKPLRGAAVTGKRPARDFQLYQEVYFSMGDDWRVAHVQPINEEVRHDCEFGEIHGDRCEGEGSWYGESDAEDNASGEEGYAGFSNQE